MSKSVAERRIQAGPLVLAHLTVPNPPIWYQQNRGLAVDATQEEWRPVVGHEGHYEVSGLGRVRSLDRTITRRDGVQTRLKGKLLNPYRSPGPRNYFRVGLSSKDGRPYQGRVHALVLEAFVGPRPEGFVACHNDGDDTNNRAENLRWDTYSENNFDMVRHGTQFAASKTHCKHGHEFTPANTIVLPTGGHRKCRRCQADANRRSRLKRLGRAS